MASPPRSYAKDPNSLGTSASLVTPGPADLPGGVAKGVQMLASGDLTIVPARNADADTITFTGVAAGFIPGFRVRRVTACTSSCIAIYD